MSITNSLANALSGLNAASRRAEVVSANVANATTEGYGRRRVDLSSSSVAGNGAGVRVDGITRLVDIGIVQDRRLADAGLADSNTRAGFLLRLETAIGSPDAAGSLSNRIAQFDAALVEAAGRPDSDVRLGNVLSSAQNIISHLGVLSSEVQSARMEADQNIASEVSDLNSALSQVRDLNREISAQMAKGQDAVGLMDQRQLLVDKIADVIPVRQIERDQGQISLFTERGAVLLDGKAAEIGFTPAGVITPDMQIGASVLSGLTLNGTPISTDSTHSRLSGGSLIANFAVRDELAVSAQVQLDAIARDLVVRFQDTGVDPTLTPTSAGLFTDGGGALDILNEEGLSQRLQINSAADPAQGGALWRIRDGLGAVTPGDIGQSSQLDRLTEALRLNTPTASGTFSPNSRNFSKIATDFLSEIGSSRQKADADVSYAAIQSVNFRTQELRDGVDTDQEMQELLIVEAAFAANARVMQTADELIQILIGL